MIYVCEHHDSVLRLWRDRDFKGIALAHVDFHDDLRGLLIDRKTGRALSSRALGRGDDPPDAGNFLAHGVIEGRLKSVNWVHDTIGGRAWDMGIVRYADDWTAWPRRLFGTFSGGNTHRLEFHESLLRDWHGLMPGERLSLDWDCFASILQDARGIGGRVQMFLERLGPHVPEDSYIALSPEYSRPGLDAFNELIAELARRFDQSVHWVDPGLSEGRIHPTDLDTRLPTGLLGRFVLSLRRRGIY